MDTDITPDEQPKKVVAKRVITPKRRYFVPEHGVSIEAVDQADADKKVKKLSAPAQKEGDE